MSEKLGGGKRLSIQRHWKYLLGEIMNLTSPSAGLFLAMFATTNTTPLKVIQRGRLEKRSPQLHPGRADGLTVGGCVLCECCADSTKKNTT